MVVFTCNQCGEPLKKAQVEKHCQTKCRNCNMVSCIDCGKDFWGNDYEQHTKCISEEEKYSGKNFVAKASANKGEKKQQEWLQQVQEAIDKVQTNPNLKRLLTRMKDYPNIPRAKRKFENFMSNSLKVNQHLCEQVWTLLMENTTKKQPPPIQQTPPASNSNDQSETNNHDNSSSSTNGITGNDTNEQKDIKTLNKRERKEQRKQKTNKVEKKEKHLHENEENGDDVSKLKKKKKKKRKHEESEDEAEQIEEVSKKRKMEDNEECDEASDDDVPPKKTFKTKFDWNGTITEILQSKGELKIKKVRKKVLAEYLSQGCTERSEEKLWATFDRKVKKNPVFKVLNDRVKLVT